MWTVEVTNGRIPGHWTPVFHSAEEETALAEFHALFKGLKPGFAIRLVSPAGPHGPDTKVKWMGRRPKPRPSQKQKTTGKRR